MVENLPDQIHAYRSQDTGNAFGLAWTTDRQVAEGFAHGHRGILHDDPYVTRSPSIGRRSFCCDDRGEYEIVLLRVTVDMVRQAI